MEIFNISREIHLWSISQILITLLVLKLFKSNDIKEWQLLNILDILMTLSLQK